ncbi:E3 ubiquitin-protein ligase RNF25 isoform X4 [Pipistrellus kuhlii]|uniref:E3 ubiquitin-protein ligase RNF25 isoform X4 n=1 Tax=Pipistrellus kuhlii TaxID=59472 RepID=UPI00174F75A8|nr:E3 ubiquitin-protein ligase RNF25 isoform X4 [Pipistrellus kuhlii]
MAGVRHGRSASPCTLPRQKTRTHSTSASLWCFRSQPSIPMRCHRSLFVTPEDSQMNRSTRLHRPWATWPRLGWGLPCSMSSSRKGRKSSQITISHTASASSASMASSALCPCSLQENEAFTKTRCYHYFHCHCLARYIQHMEQELRAQGQDAQEQERQHAAAKQKAVGVQCPVCREPLVYDLASLKAAPEPQQPMELYKPNAESLRQREELRRLYQRQQERGGIIDLEAERNRYFISLQQPPAQLEPESAVDASRGSQPLSALATELSPSSTAQPTQSAPLPVASQYMCEKIPGTGPNQQRLSETQKTILDTPRANRGPGRQPERRHLKGEYNAHRGTKDTQELPLPEGPPKEPMDVKPEEPRNRGVGGPSPENGPGSCQGPPPRRTRDCARWERPKSRTPGSSHPRLPRGRGTCSPGTRREPVSLESEDGS